MRQDWRSAFGRKNKTLRANWGKDKEWIPRMDAAQRERLYAGWKKAGHAHAGLGMKKNQTLTPIPPPAKRGGGRVGANRSFRWTKPMLAR